MIITLEALESVMYDVIKIHLKGETQREVNKIKAPPKIW